MKHNRINRFDDELKDIHTLIPLVRLKDSIRMKSCLKLRNQEEHLNVNKI